MQTILVTGHAGFIGSNLVKRLFQELKEGTIVGVDNLNDYYDPSLKEYRLQHLEKAKPAGLNYISIKGSIADRELIDRLFQQYQFDIVVNLAAQAGVRYSIENPDVYIESNIIGFYNILEACRHSMSDVRSKKEDVNAQPTAKAAIEREESDARINSPEREQARRAASMVNGQCSTVNGKQSTANVQCSTLNVQYKGVQHLVYASSSSVYGGNKKIPFSTDDRVDNPVSLYAATKKSNELMAHCYSKLYNIPSTGLRFFTVYGPAGRPDMAYFGFTNKLLKGDTIQIFNYGNCRRDFTYVDDIVEGIWRVMQRPPASPQPSPEGKGDKSVPLGKDLGKAGIHTADPMMYGLLKERAEENRKNPTEAEKVLWKALRANGLGLKFRQQHIIEDFIVDFFCNEYKVTVEVDGGYHKRADQMKSDEARTARLNELGFTELRFTNEEVLCDLDNVLNKIKTFCSDTPFPSGEGRGEAVPYAVYNIGGGQPENLLDFVNILQEELVRAGVLPKDYDFDAHKQLVPMQPGDVPTTYADASALERDFGFVPKITLREGLRKFAEWYKEYYG